MTATEKKYREFWINADARGECQDVIFSEYDKDWEGLVHVIEFSAVTELKEENNRLKMALEFYANKETWCSNPTAEIYKDVLPITDSQKLDDFWYGGKVAREALNPQPKGVE